MDAAKRFNDRVANDGYALGTEPHEWLRQPARLWKQAWTILGAADGEGRDSVWLARQGHWAEAFGLPGVGIAKARRLAQDHQARVDITLADGDGFSWQQEHHDGVAAVFFKLADPALREKLVRNMVK